MSDFKIAYIYEAIDKFSPVIDKLYSKVNKLNDKIIKSNINAVKSVDNVTKSFKKSYDMGKKWRANSGGFKGFDQYANSIKKTTSATKNLNNETRKFYDTSNILKSQLEAQAWKRAAIEKRAAAEADRVMNRLAEKRRNQPPLPTPSQPMPSPRMGGGRSIYGSGYGDLSRMSSTGGHLIGSVTAPAAGFLYASMKQVMEFEDTAMTLQTIFGEQGGKNLVHQANIFAKKNSFSQSDVHKAIMPLIGAELPESEIMPTLQLIAPFAKIGHKKLFEFSQVIGKIKTQKVLLAQELYQFTDRGIGLLTAIATEFNTTPQQVRKDMEAGLITDDITMHVLKRMNDPDSRLYGLMDKQSKTLSASFNRLMVTTQNSLARTGDEIVRLTDAKSLLDDFDRSINTVSDSFVKFAQTSPNLAKTFLFGAGGLAVMAPILTFVGELGLGVWGLVKGGGALLTVLRLLVLTPIGAALTGMGLAFLFAYQNSEKLRNSIERIFGITNSNKTRYTFGSYDEVKKVMQLNPGMNYEDALNKTKKRIGDSSGLGAFENESPFLKMLYPGLTDQQLSSNSEAMKANLTIDVRSGSDMVQKISLNEEKSGSGWNLNLGQNMTQIPNGAY